MSLESRRKRARTYGRRIHDVRTRPPVGRGRPNLDAFDRDTHDYMGREIAPETDAELRAREGDR